MYYVGVDLHKEQSWFYVMDEKGNRISSKSISNNIEILKQFFQSMPRPFTLAVESTYNWYFFVDLAERFADTVYLANSYELKAFAKRHKKTDKIDARLIADILRKEFLPTVYITDKQTRSIKEFVRYRMNLVKDRSRTIFRLKALLDKLGLDSTGNFTTLKDLMAIDSTPAAAYYQLIIKRYVDQLLWYCNKLAECRKELQTIVNTDTDMISLMTIPGISFFSAALIKSEIADINRFKSFNRLCAYAGLAPRVHQSANVCKNGPLNRNRSKNLQWILIENVMHFIKKVPSVADKHERIKKRKGFNTAKVACARDMLKVIYHVLKEKRVFYQSKEYNLTHTALALTGV